MAALPDSHDVTGNVLSATDARRGGLDERSQRRLWERLAQLVPGIDVAAWDTMEPTQRTAALRDAIRQFEESPQGRALTEEIRTDNEARHSEGDLVYRQPRVEDKIALPARQHRPGRDVVADDVTTQALANAWPQTIFGRTMGEVEAFHVLQALVANRGLAFSPASINVVGVRGYQGGAIHNNGHLMFTRQNTYDDTVFILSMIGTQPMVRQMRATVDPGTGASAFQVAADQQWQYHGNSRGRSEKYHRAMYTFTNPSEVQRGRYWSNHDLPDDGGSGRIIRHRGELHYDRLAGGGARGVSAVHSGGRHGINEQVGGDSAGCTVVHGEWFAYFNETLRRAEQARAAAATAPAAAPSSSPSSSSPDASSSAPDAPSPAVPSSPAASARAGGDGVQFTYSLIDPSMYDPAELQRILDTAMGSAPDPAAAASSSSPASAPTPAPASPPG